MCISDLRLGRYIRHVKTPFNVTGGVATTIGPSNQRIGIAFHTSTAIATSASWINVLSDGVATGILTLNALIREYELAKHGDMVQKGWSVTQGSGNLAGCIIEYLLDEQILEAHFNEFRRRL